MNQNGLGRSSSLNQNAAGVVPFVLNCRSKAYPALCKFAVFLQNVYHELPLTSHDLQMNTQETILLKALKLKQSMTGCGELTEHFINAGIKSDPEEAKKELRNICAFISIQLFEKVEGLCSTLSLSKRQLVEMALIDVIDKAEKIMADVNPFEGVEPDAQPVSQLEG